VISYQLDITGENENSKICYLFIP